MFIIYTVFINKKWCPTCVQLLYHFNKQSMYQELCVSNVSSIRHTQAFTFSYYLNSVFTRHQTFDLAPYSIHYHKISLKYRIHFLNNRVMISCFRMKLPCGSLLKNLPRGSKPWLYMLYEIVYTPEYYFLRSNKSMK